MMPDKALYRVPLIKKIAYAVPGFFLAVVGIPVYVCIPKFYADVIGVNIAVLGYILFSVRIFDAVTDPALGYLSDRTRTRMGRRRPYIAAASTFVALTMFLLFSPPRVSASLETAWFAGCIYALFLCWTAVVVPYESLGPEITFYYNERTSLFGMRDGFLIAGTLAAASSPAVVQWLFGLAGDPDGERAKFFWIAVIYAPLLIGSCWRCVLAIKELPQGPTFSTTGIWQGFRQIGRKTLIAVLVTLWGLRLGTYLSRSNWGAGEDPRYGEWRKKSGNRFWVVSLYKVFLVQAVVLWTISLVLQVGQLAPKPDQFIWLDILGVFVWVLGFLFEAVGDRQLARFKANPVNKGRVMDRGLWAYSRHPNYFGEFLVWWGFYLIALSTPNSWWTVISPLMITAVLLKMTGIPLTEEAIMKTRPGYKDYIQRTSAFVPWFPRKEVQ